MHSKSQSPHRRWNPLRQSWVLVSPHRTQRPWQGEVAQKTAPSGGHYDPECYLCPGNQRAGGAVNPPYESVFSFVNDYAALLPERPMLSEQPRLAAAHRRAGPRPVQGALLPSRSQPDPGPHDARGDSPRGRRLDPRIQELARLDWIRTCRSLRIAAP